VAWQRPDNTTAREESQTIEANAYGASLEMNPHARPPVGATVTLTNRVSNEVAQAQVIAIRLAKGEAVVVELLVPSETFWGTVFRVKKLAADLRALEEDIKSGGVDPLVLREFRDAVDFVRKTAWAVSEWQERQFRHKDSATVLSLLTTERVRRATQLNDAVFVELDAQRLTDDSPGVPDLTRAVERICKRLCHGETDQKQT
jgi:hypothetical protein